MFWCLRFCFLGSFPEEVLWKLDSLRGTSHWRAAQGKPSDRGARIQRYLSPTRQGLHNWGLNGPGWETHPRPPETPLRESPTFIRHNGLSSSQDRVTFCISIQMRFRVLHLTSIWYFRTRRKRSNITFSTAMKERNKYCNVFKKMAGRWNPWKLLRRFIW